MDDKGQINHGGPAFPIPAVYSEGQGMCQGWDGMTLRDYFAAKALQGELSGQHDNNMWADMHHLAARCVKIADALILALKASK